MSHHVLQRVVVRLLFDPEFVDRVYADPDRALEGLDLSPAERRLAVAPDRRAYATDATRRSRALTELVREFPAASAVALHGGGGGRGGGRGGHIGGHSGGHAGVGIEILERFFASPIFHAVIQDRGSIAAGYAAYLEHGAASGALRDPRAGALARLEGAVAQVRRAPRNETVSAAAPEASEPDAPEAPNAPESSAVLTHRLVLTPKAALVTVPAGTFDLLAEITGAIAGDGRDPVAQVLEPNVALRRVLASRGGAGRFRAPRRRQRSPAARRANISSSKPPPPTEPEADAHVSPVTPELAGLLRAAAPPGAELQTLMATAQALGAEAGEEEALILDLARQGLLVPAEP